MQERVRLVVVDRQERVVGAFAIAAKVAAGGGAVAAEGVIEVGDAIAALLRPGEVTMPVGLIRNPFSSRARPLSVIGFSAPAVRIPSSGSRRRAASAGWLSVCIALPSGLPCRSKISCGVLGEDRLQCQEQRNAGRLILAALARQHLGGVRAELRPAIAQHIGDGLQRPPVVGGAIVERLRERGIGAFQLGGVILAPPETLRAQPGELRDCRSTAPARRHRLAACATWG